MQNLLRLGLILTLVLFSTGLGLARGQTAIGGQVVLCSGGSVVTMPGPVEGQGERRQLICPEMAAGLIALIPPPAIWPPEVVFSDASVSRMPVVAGHDSGPRPRQARGPPLTDSAVLS